MWVQTVDSLPLVKILTVGFQQELRNWNSKDFFPTPASEHKEWTTFWNKTWESMSKTKKEKNSETKNKKEKIARNKHTIKICNSFLNLSRDVTCRIRG